MNRILWSVVFAGVLAGGAFGAPKGAYRKQQQRIGQGVKSGQLTARETSNLESKERAINGQVRADKLANGGQLTSAEKAQVRSEHAGLSKQIYTDKHNAAKDHFGNSEVGHRQENQQDRIAQGIQSGKLNANEASHLENREAGLNQEVRDDRSVNGGKLTPAERRQVNQQQNGISNSIKKDKSN
jgi:hypothetical protein